MTYWNTGLFLVIKKLWAGIVIAAVAGLALWKLGDLFWPKMEQASRFLWSVTYKLRSI